MTHFRRFKDAYIRWLLIVGCRILLSNNATPRFRLPFLFTVVFWEKVCPLGYYCPDGTATPTLRCPAGTFGAMPGMEHESCSGECQQGYFCLPG